MGLFDKVRLRRPSRNKFDLSHEKKLSCRMGNLIPIMVQDIIPGDSFRVKSEIMLRMAPMLAPIMHRVNVYTHYFFVPNRLVWSEWEDFITGGREGISSPVAPTMSMDDLFASGFLDVSGLSDYMGLPTLTAAPIVEVGVSALPFRAYQQIYDEYYRDQNLEASLAVSKASGPVVGAELGKLATIRQRAWEKDYFTSALPWAQRGPEVLMPIEGDATVNYIDQGGVLFHQDGTPIVTGGPLDAIPTTGDGAFPRINGSTEPLNIRNIESVEFENSTVTINEFRRSIRLQEWLEKNARGGARYVEQILSHFGVKSSDARLQRPEYLGGGRTPVMISEVLSTFQDPTGAGNPQANMAGHGASFGTTNGFKRSFEEHGYVIGIMSVIPRTAYQQGIPRHFSKFDKFDYFWPEFANLGEQEIKQQEIWYADSGVPSETFGYQSRYAEYKYACSSVHGTFRTNQAFWHMGRIFSSTPSLNEEFVMSDPTDRIFAVPEAQDKLYCHLYNRVDAIRPMPYFGTPTI